jgi:transposase-like protein
VKNVAEIGFPRPPVPENCFVFDHPVRNPNVFRTSNITFPLCKRIALNSITGANAQASGVVIRWLTNYSRFDIWLIREFRQISHTMEPCADFCNKRWRFARVFNSPVESKSVIESTLLQFLHFMRHLYVYYNKPCTLAISHSYDLKDYSDASYHGENSNYYSGTCIDPFKPLLQWIGAFIFLGIGILLAGLAVVWVLERDGDFWGWVGFALFATLGAIAIWGLFSMLFGRWNWDEPCEEGNGQNKASHRRVSIAQEKTGENLKIVLDTLGGVKYYRRMSKSTISTFKLFETFPDEASARTYLEGRLWPNGVKCPECKGGERITTRKAGYYRCNACKLDFTVRTGTIFERSHVPLQKWIYAMYLVVTARKGISSMQLAKEIGITQKSAWFVLHRLREACNDNTSKLSGFVEIDETFVGGLSRNMHKSKREAAITGTGGKDKTAVLGMRERGGKTLAMTIETTSAKEIQGAINARVEVGSTLMTDEHAAYNGMEGLFFQQERVNHSAGEYVRGMAHTNGIESVWAVLKRGLHGIYHHVTVKHLGRYVDEFSFRLNAGNVKRHTLDRLASFVDAVAGKRITYRELTA